MVSNSSYVIVCDQSTPKFDDLLEIDFDFHFGSEDDYDFNAIEVVWNAKTPPPSVMFAGVCPNIERIKHGSQFSDFFASSPDGLREIRPGWSGQAGRQYYTINRDFRFFNSKSKYLFDTLDSRFVDYAKHYNLEKSPPVFQYHRLRHSKAVIIPLSGYHQYPSNHLRQFSDEISFQDKIPVAFWRGGIAGTVPFRNTLWHTHSIAGLEDLNDEKKISAICQSSRFKLSIDSLGEDGVDIKIVRPPSHHPIYSISGFPDGIWSPPIPIEEQLKYRYLLALDGYDGPSSWYWMLKCNSVILRQNSNWEMFGDVYFKPWIHFVPIEIDAKDILSKVNYLEKNLGLCEYIIRNANTAWNLILNSAFKETRQKYFYDRYNQIAKSS